MYRYRIEAYRTNSERNLSRIGNSATTAVPVINNANTAKGTKNIEAGGLSNLSVGGGSLSQPPTDNGHHVLDRPLHDVDGARDLDGEGGAAGGGGAGVRRDGSHAEKAAHNDHIDALSQSTPPAASPPIKSEAASTGDSTITDTPENGKKKKNPMTIARMKAGSKRFVGHLKDAVCHSWINVLLVAVPAGIAAEAAGLQPAVVFSINAVAIVPLAGMLAHATESVASRLGDTLGALLNVSFGNAVELIIFIIALVKNEISIVQASLLGSILANLLLILGMAFLFGGLRFREQVYNSTVTQMSACLLSLSVISLLLPTAFHASFNDDHLAQANSNVLKVSRGVSVILLLIYVLYLVFQLKSHAYMYESTPQHIVDEESHPGVLHDLMNSSSSSSDSSSSSSSSDTDSDASGSVATTSKRVKRMFKHSKRRKSSASTSTTATILNLPSVISSPSTEKPSTDYFKDPSRPASRHESTLAAIASGDEGDNEDGRTRTFDWAERHNSIATSKSPDPPKRHRTRRAKKREKERKRRQKQEDAADVAAAEASGAPFATTSNGPSKVAFSEDLQTSEIPAQNASPSKLPFNIRAPAFPPALSSYLSSTVFSSQQPVPINGVSPRAGPVRPVSAGPGGLRRTNSLPDRLNRSAAPAQASSSSGPLRTIQHQVGKTPTGLSNDTPAAVVDDEEGEAVMSRTAAVVLLLGSTALVAVCAEFMVDAIPGMISNSSVSEAFIGLIILPIVGNAAEHVTAVTVAAKNKMDLAIGIAVGSSIQIALFVTPIVVLLGWILNTEMSLYFNIFETVSLFVTVFVVNFLVLDGRSNYLEGSLLIAAYVIIAVASFFYPASASQSNIGGGGGGGAGSS